MTLPDRTQLLPLDVPPRDEFLDTKPSQSDARCDLGESLENEPARCD
jgi:hypothetical protein